MMSGVSLAMCIGLVLLLAFVSQEKAANRKKDVALSHPASW